MNDFHNNKSKIMLVDGDLLAYKITSALEEPIDWGNDVWTLHSDFGKAKQLWTQSIAYYLDITSSKDVVVAFSDKILASGSISPSLFESFVSSSTGNTIISFSTLNTAEFNAV